MGLLVAMLPLTSLRKPLYMEFFQVPMRTVMNRGTVILGGWELPRQVTVELTAGGTVEHRVTRGDVATSRI